MRYNSIPKSLYFGSLFGCKPADWAVLRITFAAAVCNLIRKLHRFVMLNVFPVRVARGHSPRRTRKRQVDLVGGDGEGPGKARRIHRSTYRGFSTAKVSPQVANSGSPLQ